MMDKNSYLNVLAVLDGTTVAKHVKPPWPEQLSCIAVGPKSEQLKISAKYKQTIALASQSRLIIGLIYIPVVVNRMTSILLAKDW